MGSWDEFNLAIELRKDTPKAVIDILDVLINSDRSDEIIVEEVSVPASYTSLEIPQHPFFADGPVWCDLLSMDCAYFAGVVFADFSFERYLERYQLTIRAKIKYGWGIEEFLHWIAPYSATTGIVGNRRRDELPDYFYLIWLESGKAYLQEINVEEVQPSKREEIVMR